MEVGEIIELYGTIVGGGYENSTYCKFLFDTVYLYYA